MTRAFCRQAILLGVVLALLAWMAAPALAAPSAGPAKWVITSAAGPAHFKPFKPGEKDALYIVSATNVGGEATSGAITIKDSLQGKAEMSEVAGSHPPGQEVAVYGDAFTHEPLSCELTSPSSSTCSYTKKVDPGDALTFAIRVHVSESASEGETITNSATVSGGGAEPEEESTSEPTTEPTPVSSEPVRFGIFGH